MGEIGRFTRRVRVPSYLTVGSFITVEDLTGGAVVRMDLLVSKLAGGELAVAFLELLLEGGEHGD
jgi:hypothetical protein